MITSVIFQPDVTSRLLFPRLLSSLSKQSQHIAPRYDFVDKYDFAIYASGPGRLKAKTIEAARISIVRKTKTRNMWKIEATTPVTKKAMGSRMGKGQGKIDHYVAEVNEGKVLFQFNSENETKATEAFRLVSFLVPMKVYFRKRPPQNKIVWTEF